MLKQLYLANELQRLPGHETAKGVADLARATGETRNAIVGQAISSLLERTREHWPDEIRL